MEPRVNYALVGVFVVALATAAVATGLWLTTGLDRTEYRRYSIYMNESAYGLGRDSTVTYYGVNVGRVVDVRIEDHGDKNVQTIIEVQADTPVTEGTVASLSVRGVTGIAYIELSGGERNGRRLRAPKGEPYPVIPYKRSLITRLDQAVNEGMNTLERIGNRIDALLSPENIKHINGTLANVETLTAQLSDRSRQLKRTLDDVSRAARSGSGAADQARETLRRAQKALDDFTRMTASVNHAAGEIADLGRQGQDTMGDIRHQTLPQLRALSAELRNAASALRALGDSLRRDPGQLLRGRQRPAPGPGEPGNGGTE